MKHEVRSTQANADDNNRSNSHDGLSNMFCAYDANAHTSCYVHLYTLRLSIAGSAFHPVGQLLPHLSGDETGCSFPQLGMGRLIMTDHLLKLMLNILTLANSMTLFCLACSTSVEPCDRAATRLYFLLNRDPRSIPMRKLTVLLKWRMSIDTSTSYEEHAQVHGPDIGMMTTLQESVFKALKARRPRKAPTLAPEAFVLVAV